MREERLAATTGLAGTLAVGVAGLVSDAMTQATQPILWWLAYGVFVGAFVADSELFWRRPSWQPSWALVMIEVGAVLTLWSAAPDVGWSSILFVVSAVSAAYALTTPGTVAVVAVQTVAIAVGVATLGRPVADVVLTTFVYAVFQSFAALLVVAGRRETEGRVALAAAHAGLRAANALLASSSRDAERVRIARDLHDVVGHQLTALALELEVASHRVTGEQAAEHVGRAREITKTLLHDVRQTVGDLRDEPHGLTSALQEVVRLAPGLRVELDVRERAPIDRADALTVLRCVQELVTNTLRHAGARSLTVSVDVAPDGVTLDARDDGRGVRRLELGHGLTGMSERVAERGGRISFETAAEAGFAVHAWIPAP